MSGIVVSGWLLEREILARVLGNAVAMPALSPIEIIDHSLRGVFGPRLVADSGAHAPAMQIESLCALGLSRLQFFAGEPVSVILSDGSAAVAYCGAQDGNDQAWNFAAQWAAHGPLICEATGQQMRGFGQISGAVSRARWGMVLVRASSTLRARNGVSPATLRRVAVNADVEVQSVTLGYAKFFAVEDYVLTHQSFAGGQSKPPARAAFVSGDAVVILPYDPQRDLVLLVEQFRAGPYARGDTNPWSLEPVAGRIDGGETPEAAGRREGEEEAGVTFSDLIAAPHYYPSPGAKTEFLYNFVGLCDLSARPIGGGGLDEEGEDIRSHLIPFAQLMDLIASGEVNNGPLIVLAYWLAHQRDKLRAK
jgi:nudix-type nucleoside diphosphatase (YffH/AdpP family)